MSEALAEHPAPPPPRFVADLDTLIRARYPLIYLVTWEEQRLDGILQDLAAQHGKVLFGWSVTRGLRRIGGARTVPHLDPQKSPVEMLATLGKLGEPSLVVLSVLDVPLPGFRELYQLLREIGTVVRQGNQATIDLSREQAEQLIKAAQGLTLSEAENAFAKAIATDGRLSGNDVRLVLEEKRQVIRKSGLLEFVSVDEDLGNVGGVDTLKQWLGNRAAAFGEPARKFGLPAPKGLLPLGVQGCGKSLTAKAIANQWALPLLRLDMGRIFSNFIGSSEENLRKAIRVAESVAPAVLWVDEIEKGLSGTASSGQVDGGVTARVFGAMLTWLQEKTAPVFVVATANKIEALPPELLRKGRFDEIFFIDLPASAERREIWSIHLSRRKRDPAQFDLAELAQVSEAYSGSEIEQAVISGLHFAFAEGAELQQKHLVRAVQETIPLATTMGEDIARQREWAKTRARPASGRAKPPKVAEWGVGSPGSPAGGGLTSEGS